MIGIITPATRLHHFRFRTYKLFSACILLSRVHVNVFRNKRFPICVCPSVRPESRAPVERCTFWRSVYCGSARSHHQQAALQPPQPRSIEYAWRNVGEMTSPFYSTPPPPRSAICPHNTSNKLFSTILSSPLLHTYRQSTLRWLYQTVLKSDSPLRFDISATL